MEYNKVCNFKLAVASGREDEETGALLDATHGGTRVRVGGPRQPFVLVRCGEESNFPVFFWRRHGKDVQTYDVYKGDPKMPLATSDILSTSRMVKHWYPKLPDSLLSWLNNPDHPTMADAPERKMWAAEEAAIEPGCGLAVMGILRRGNPRLGEPEFILEPIREQAEQVHHHVSTSIGDCGRGKGVGGRG